jgi:NADPH2:quinone reductase
VQLAKLFGAGLVIAAASTAEKRALALKLGADAAIDYTKPDWASSVKQLTAGRGVDIVLEMTGGPTLTRALDALAPFGRMVVYGSASGEGVTVDPQRLMAPNHSVTGFYIGAYFQYPEKIRQGIAEIVGHVSTGLLKLQVGAVFPMALASEAHRYLESRQSTGKVVLQPWGAP